MGIAALAPLALKAAPAILGLLGGRRGSREMRDLAKSIKEGVQFGRDVFERGEERAQPFRDAFESNVLKFGQDPSSITGTPAFAAGIGTLGEASNTLRGQLEERLPRGGALSAALGRSFTDEARGRSKLMSDLFRRYEDIGLNLAKGPSVGEGIQAGTAGIPGLSFLSRQASDTAREGFGVAGEAGGEFGRSLFNLLQKGNINLPDATNLSFLDPSFSTSGQRNVGRSLLENVNLNF